MEFLAIAQTVAPAIAGFLAVGGIGSLFAYWSAKPKTQAEALKINSEVVVTFATGWEKYANKLEERLEATEKKQMELSQVLDAQELKYRDIISQKDTEIKNLQNRVGVLEEELERYKPTSDKQNTAREAIHESVDTAMDNLNIKP